MGQKTVRFSDLSGQLIMDDDALARIVVHEHPGLVDGPVEIEALTGAIVAAGERYGIATPLNRALLTLARAVSDANAAS